VAPIARHYARLSPETADDLTQVGLLGLMRATELFVPSRGLPFEPFARQHIRGAILHYLRDQAPLLRIPRRRQELELQRRRCERRLEAEAGKSPTPEAVRQAMGLSQTQWARLDRAPATLRIVPLDDATEPMASDPGDDGLGDPRGAQALAMMDKLPPLQAGAIKAVILSGQSLRQVAIEWQVSASTVHRQLHQGLAELRRRLESPSDVAAC
jgi:RNA polymerase sigma-B factor